MAEKNKKKEILTVCLECGRKYDRKHKSSFGVWIDTCDICGQENVACAAAGHDFGIYSSDELEAIDKIQDRI